MSDGKRLATFKEICGVELDSGDEIAQVIFEACYWRNPDVNMSWRDVQYQAPETPAGWAARNAQNTANEIRLRFHCLPWAYNASN